MKDKKVKEACRIAGKHYKAIIKSGGTRKQALESAISWVKLWSGSWISVVPKDQVRHICHLLESLENRLRVLNSITIYENL